MAKDIMGRAARKRKTHTGMLLLLFRPKVVFFDETPRDSNARNETRRAFGG